MLVCLVFGILNLVGSSKVKKTEVEFINSDCSGVVCSRTAEVNLDRKTFLYLDFSDMQTSYFVYSKGLNYGDIFKSSSSLSDNKECYPIETFGEMKTVAAKLGVTTSVPNGKPDGDRVKPCGLKAFLFNHLGTLSVKYSSNSTTVALSNSGIVHSKFKGLAKKSDEDYIDVTNESFLSWYIPQVPGFGTKILAGALENGFKGNLTFEFDASRRLSNS